jgi:integrase
MIDNDIKVLVVKYPDRRFFMMRYTDPVTGKHKARSTGTKVRREAERAAAKWEAELREGRYHAPSKLLWQEFRERYESEKLSGLADNTAAATTTAFNHLERVIGPEKLLTVNATTISRFQAKLRQEGMKDTTLATHLRHLHAALGWAVSMGMLPKVPDFHMPKKAKGRKLMRGRPITTEEFERMLAKVPDVRPKDTSAWVNYLNGLWLSGLRLEESTILSWDEDLPFSIDLSGQHPQFRIYAEAEKGNQDRMLPMTPDFADFILRTPDSERTGPVFKLVGLHTGKQLASTTVGRTISEIGEKAGVVVNKAEGKYASAHDFRRSFGTRWAPKVKPATLQLLMRHKSIETTMKYYVAQNADDVAAELWAAHNAPDRRKSRRRQRAQKRRERRNPRK